jgi:SAM-dependent methyltransferase
VTPEGSVSFDRAAAYYDATRAIPDATLAALCDALAGELPAGRCLEIGVGTGRIALPLASRGRDIVGIDISEQMLAKLQDKSGASDIRVAVADAMALPFDDDTFSGAYGVHVLHLIVGWADAVRELARVVRPGGRLLFELGGADVARPGGWTGIAKEIGLRFMAEAGLERRHPGINDTRDLDAVLAEFGADGEDTDPILGSLTLAPSTVVDLLDHGAMSFTWKLDESERRRAASAVRAWAEERFGDLAVPREMQVVISFRSYRLPSGDGS